MPQCREVRDQLKRGETASGRITRQPQHAPVRPGRRSRPDCLAVQSGLLGPLTLDCGKRFRAGLPADTQTGPAEGPEQAYSKGEMEAETR